MWTVNMDRAVSVCMSEMPTETSRKKKKNRRKVSGEHFTHAATRRKDNIIIFIKIRLDYRWPLMKRLVEQLAPLLTFYWLIN